MILPSHAPRALGSMLMWVHCALVIVAGILLAERAVAQPADSESAGRTGYLVDVPLPLIGDRDESVRQQIQQIADSWSGEGERPLVVLRFQAVPLANLNGEPDNGGMGTRGSQFERGLSLARMLTSSDVSRVKLVAFLPDAVEGHAVLPVLACEEIVATDSAALGHAAVDDETVGDPLIRSAYVNMAERRATLPVPVVTAMLDTSSEVYRVETTDGGTNVVDREGVEALRKEGQVLREETIWPGGSMASFSGAELEKYRWISRSVRDESELPSVLKVEGNLRTVKQLPREWKASAVTLSGAITGARVNQLIRSIDEAIDDEGLNLLVCYVGECDVDFRQATQLGTYLAALEERNVYTVGIIEQSLMGPIGLIPVCCQESVLVGTATLGPPDANGVSTKDDSIQRVLTSLAGITERPLSLLSVLVDPEATVNEYIHQGNGRRALFVPWQLEARADARDWLARAKVAGGEAIPTGVAVRYRLVDGVEDTSALALSKLGVEQAPAELKSPWLDSSIEMLLAQGWLPRLLLTIGFFALMAELGNPGIGAGGLISALCFLGFFWIEGLQGNVEMLEVLLFVGGLVALAFELFVIPGFGIFGIAGLLMLFVSVVLASQTFVWPSNSAELSEISVNLLWVACLALCGMIGLLFMHKQLERLPMLRWVTLLPEEDLDDLDIRESLAHRDHLLGQDGLTISRLNPSGKAQFGREIVPVVGTGTLIAEGVPVRVVEVRGNLVLVEELG